MPANVVMGAAALSGAMVSLWWSVAGDRRMARKTARNLQAGLEIGTNMREHLLAAPASERVVLPAAERLAMLTRRLTPASAVESLNARILKAGMSSRWPLERALAAKFLLGAFFAVFGLLFVASGKFVSVVFGLVLPVFGFFGPDLVLRAKAKERQKRIRVSMPDTLDQITVCVEAGLGFEAAMARAARTGSGPLADELLRTLQDVQLGVPRREAIARLGERNDVDELRHFVHAIVQAEGFGVPMARVLRVQSSELRDKRRQEAEERAMKVSIKMLFPLVFCILPTTFIVILAPAIIRLAASLTRPG